MGYSQRFSSFLYLHSSIKSSMAGFESGISGVSSDLSVNGAATNFITTLKYQQIYLIGLIQTSKTGGQPYSHTSLDKVSERSLLWQISVARSNFYTYQICLFKSLFLPKVFKLEFKFRFKFSLLFKGNTNAHIKVKYVKSFCILPT